MSEILAKNPSKWIEAADYQLMLGEGGKPAIMHEDFCSKAKEENIFVIYNKAEQASKVLEIDCKGFQINILPFGSNKEKNSDVLSHSNFSPYAPQGQYVYFPAGQYRRDYLKFTSLLY